MQGQDMQGRAVNGHDICNARGTAGKGRQGVDNDNDKGRPPNGRLQDRRRTRRGKSRAML